MRGNVKSTLTILALMSCLATFLLIFLLHLAPAHRFNGGISFAGGVTNNSNQATPPSNSITNLYSVNLLAQYGSVLFNGTNEANGSLVHVASGTYEIRADENISFFFYHWSAAGGVSTGNYLAQNTTATVTGNGTLIAYYHPYALLHESGLPQNATWRALINGTEVSTTNGSIIYPLMAGTYSFSIQNITYNGTFYHPEPASGTLNAGTQSNITFVQCCKTSFTEEGLPSNTLWGITLNGSYKVANSPNAIFFSTTTGNYSFYTHNSSANLTAYMPNITLGRAEAGNSYAIVFSALARNQKPIVPYEIKINSTYQVEGFSLNGINYNDGNIADMPSGTYQINATAPNGTIFFYWNTYGSRSIAVSNPESSNTTVSITGNGTITAEFKTPSSAPAIQVSHTTNGSAANPGKAGLQSNSTPAVISMIRSRFGSSLFVYTPQQPAGGAYNSINPYTSQNSFISTSTGVANLTTSEEPVPLSYQNMSAMTSLNASALSYIMGSIANYSSQQGHNAVDVVNASIHAYYGQVIQGGKYADAGSMLRFAAYGSQGVLSIYNVSILKTEPNFSMNIDGAIIHGPGVYPIHVPILPGQTAWNLNISATSSLLPGNSGTYIYYVKLSNGTFLVPVSSTTASSFSQKLNRRLPAEISANVTIDFGGDSNYTQMDPSGPTIPSPIKNYWQVTVDNTQSSATGNYFQLMVPFNALNDSIANYVSNTLNNAEWFYPNGTLISSWFEGNALNTLQSSGFNSLTSGIYWLKLNPSIAASSNTYIYYGAAAFGTNLLSSTVDGMAPQLYCASGCPETSYGEFDDGYNVFLYYNPSPASTAGWTVAGTAGQTSSAPAGSYFDTTDAYDAHSASGDYLYRQVAGLSANQIITYWAYTTGLGNFFFLTNSAGAGQMTRLDGRGGTDYSGLASTASWTSWSAPSSGLSETKNQWYKFDITISGTTANSYIGGSNAMIETLGTFSDSHAVSLNGNYLGLVGDGLGSTYLTYWNGMVIRSYPPNDVMPTTTFSAPIATTSPVILSIGNNPISYGTQTAIGASCYPNTSTCEILVNSVLEASGTGSASYTFPTSAVGAYTVNGFNANTGTSSISILTVTKTTPSITLPSFPSNLTYGLVGSVTANIVTVNNQLSANDYVNGVLHSSFNIQDQFSESAVGNYTITANTIGNANYTAASITKTFYICPAPSSSPSGIVYFACVYIINRQSSATPSGFQQSMEINESSLAGYLSYNGNAANFEYFYPNGTLIPAWIEGNSLGEIMTWINLSPQVPANGNYLIYLGFNGIGSNFLSGSGISGIGEAPLLSSQYGQYDDGSSVFQGYLPGNSLNGWTSAGTAGQTSSAPAGSPFGNEAFYANGGNGDYLYTQASGQSSNMIIEYYTNEANLDDLFFLASSSGAGQIGRIGNGGGWYGVASSLSWTSWSAPPDSGTWSNEWLLTGIVVSSGAATMYTVPSALDYGSEIGYNQSNTYTTANDGDYLGLVGDAGGSTSVEYWNGMIIRGYPPNGVMPSVGLSAPAPANACQISLSANAISFGNISPGAYWPTNVLVTDTNSGSANAYMGVYGSNWVLGSNSFGVSNTLWSPIQQSSYTGTPLSATAANTAILVPAGSSNGIYFGLQVPTGTPAGSYPQTIVIENNC